MRGFGSLLVVLLMGGTVPASAQSEPWMVVPVEPGGEENPQVTQLSVRVRRALEAQGVAVLDDTAAGELVEEEVSQPVSELSESDITTWASSSQAALRALARADYDNAREALVAAQEVAQRAAEELNREAERAREVLDTCLFTARVFLETHQRTEAERQVRSCRVLVPEVEPRRHRHPPEIHALLDRIDAEETNGGLRVTSTPTGCTVRVNGVPQGETPFTVEQLARGDYRLQVECSEEERGRVHRVRIDDGMSEIHVDVGFDRALASRPFPRLTSEADRLEHGRRLAAALGRTVVVVATPGDAQVLRIDPDGRATQVWMAPIGDVDDAAGYLEARTSMDLRGDEPEELDSPDGTGVSPAVLAAADEPDEDDDEPAGPGLPGWRLGAGLAGALIGAGLLGTSVWLRSDQGDKGANYAALTFVEGDPVFTERQSAWLDVRTPFLTTAALAGALMGAGAGLLAPPREGMPWWGWVSAGAGLVLSVTAIALTATAADCGNVGDEDRDKRRSCVDHRQDRATAALVGFSGLPFFGVALSALLQSPDRDTQVSFMPRRDGASLHVGGSF